MRRILFQQTDFNTLPNPPAGFKYIGFNGEDFSEKDDAGQISQPGGSGGGLTDITYASLVSLMGTNGLTPGSYYRITDFRTCYDQPDYDIYKNSITTGNYKVGANHPIVVLATSVSTISQDAWQESFPKDKIRYDITWSATEHTGGTAYGRISERVDEWNNRTDYDHREVIFKRYNTYVYNPNEPQSGTISVVNGVVTGIDTTFTNFSVGSIIAIPNFSEKFFRIHSIDSNDTMSLTGSYWDVTSYNIKYYSVNDTMCGYYKNNVDDYSGDSNYFEYTTFGDALDNSSVFDNYIGDHANGFINDGAGEFLLSNNVFLDGEYSNNKFGNNCYNNTFDDDCTDNTIGNYFRNNITDDDFDGNEISNFFEDNIITANFQRNFVGVSFRDNLIINGSFYRNRIGNDFYYNNISGDDFQNNVIENAFNNNTIRTSGDGFLKNVIGVGFNNNDIWTEFESNKIGNGMNNNSLYCNFYENKIGDYFNNNTIGSYQPGMYPTISFYENSIDNNFYNNQIYSDFYRNVIGVRSENNTFYNSSYDNKMGNDFENNTVGSSLNIGGYSFTYNVIGNWCKGNNFAQNVQSNVFGSGFWTNEFFGYSFGNKIGVGFQDNDLYDGFVNNTIGNTFQDNIFGTNSNNNSLGNNCQYNTISDEFKDNTISNNFAFNTIGSNFKLNNIGSNFTENNISSNFAYNVIGNDFYTNVIENDFGFGGDEARGNKIGNYFNNNTIGEYFYDNIVADLFKYNTVGDYFQLNDIKANDISNVDFIVNYGNITIFTDNTGLSPSIPGTDSTYTGLTVSGGNGNGATFNVVVSGSVVTSVSLNTSGKGYNVSDVLIIPSSAFGGTLGQDIQITVSSVSDTPVVYTTTNATIVRDSNVGLKLYYLGSSSLGIIDITESYN